MVNLSDLFSQSATLEHNVTVLKGILIKAVNGGRISFARVVFGKLLYVYIEVSREDFWTLRFEQKQI